MSTYRYHSDIVLPSGRRARLFLGPLKTACTGVPYHCVRLDNDRPVCLFQKGADFFSGRCEPIPGCTMRISLRPQRGEITVSFDGVHNPQTRRATSPIATNAIRDAARTLIAIGRPEAAKHLRRYLALALHPDRGGNSLLMRDLNALIDSLEYGRPLPAAA